MEFTLESRAEQVRWLLRKFGTTAAAVWAEFTDAELRNEFSILYCWFKDKPDYVHPSAAGTDCILCDFEGWKKRYGANHTGD